MDINTLFNATKVNAIHCINNFANFSGRAGRSEFWLWTLACFVIALALNILGQIASFFFLFAGLFNLLVLVPSLAVGARRLHDTGRTGWLQLIVLIPLIGIIVLIYFWAQPSSSENNKY
ncbi:MAG: DUF805 domain-containing protein [Bdellovibrionales bacterium]|jgi:uncharacterized membrane protein YhaH (DUF805 family)|nr:DUF805 domain-containing protein [Bdellovibrionales bacterium]